MDKLANRGEMATIYTVFGRIPVADTVLNAVNTALMGEKATTNNTGAESSNQRLVLSVSG